MQTQTRFIRRDPAEVLPWAETCGAIRCLIEESDGTKTGSTSDPSQIAGRSFHVGSITDIHDRIQKAGVS